MARATRADVARKAGVSLGTVSHIMNGRAEELGFSPQTAARVREEARKLGYIPKASARALKYRSSKVIAFFFPQLPPSLRLPVFSELLIGGVESATEGGYYVLPVPLNDTPAETVANTLREIDLAGAVFRGGEDIQAMAPGSVMREAIDLLQGAEVPLAWIQTGTPVPASFADTANRKGLKHGRPIGMFGIDEVSGVEKMLSMIDLSGVKVPVIVTGVDDPPAKAVNKAKTDHLLGRETAFLSRFPQASIIRAHGWLVTNGQSVSQNLLDIGADLIFCTNDELAFGVLQGIAGSGQLAGKDIQIFGFGDASDRAELFGLSTVEWPVADLCKNAVTHLIRVIAGKESVSVSNLSTQAHARKTTIAIPRVRD